MYQFHIAMEQPEYMRLYRVINQHKLTKNRFSKLMIPFFVALIILVLIGSIGRANGDIS